MLFVIGEERQVFLRLLIIELDQPKLFPLKRGSGKASYGRMGILRGQWGIS